MSKHTPGPWRATVDAKVYGAGARWNPTFNAMTDPFIASVGGETVLESLANARLIAAAPEMYDALRDILLLDEHGGKVDVRVLMDRVRALVARVEGRDHV